VDAETRFELSFEYTPGDVWRTVLINGFDTSSTDVKELKGVFDNSQPRNANAKEKHTWNPVLLQNFHTYSSSSFPMKHLELDRGSWVSVIVSTWENRAHLLAECVDFPQEVFHPDSLAVRNIRTSLEKVTMYNRVSAEPAPGNFPESFVFAIAMNRWSLDDGAARPKWR
jgi:hypothetical protein